MRRFALLVLLTLALAVSGTAMARRHAGDDPPKPSEQTFEQDPFGEVSLYLPGGPPRHLVLFASGDGGWKLGVIDMARSLVKEGAAVAGVDVVRYLKALKAQPGDCFDAAGDWRALARTAAAKAGMDPATPAVLIGYSSGATLVYGILVQDTAGAFAGGVSLGFCPDISLSRSLCRVGSEPLAGPGEGKGINFLPGDTHGPWIALVGWIDQVCHPGDQLAYVSVVAGGLIILLPHVGHGFGKPKNWERQFLESYRVAARDSAGNFSEGSLLAALDSAGGFQTIAWAVSGGLLDVERGFGLAPVLRP